MTPTRHRLTHRPIVALAVGTAALMALSACGSASSESGESGSASSGGLSSGNSAYDAIVNGGPQADSAAVEANTWAAAVKKAGTLRVGGTETSTLFSNLDPTTGVVTGFDAGITQLLARYILGDASRTTLTQVSVDTREELLVNGQVDLVAATYSITPARLERIDFAGPYYSSQAGIMVKADNTDITGVGDLAGKTVATQAGSTGETVIAKYAPEATVLALPDNAQALQAVQQGRADAYVIDQTLLLNNVVKDPTNLKVVGEPFGDADLYGIGVPKGSDAAAFINTFLKTIEDDGTWLKLWQTTIQAQTKVTSEPTPPAIGEGID